MHAHQDTHTEAAIYWSAVSLIVCEGLSIRAAAERLGIENGELRNILRVRRRFMAARLHSSRMAAASGRWTSVTDSRHARDP